VPSDWTDSINAIQGLDSDLDPGAVDNATEIVNNTQPGWTTTINPLYDRSSCDEVAADSTVPTNVPTPYDLVVTGDPVANAGGPYQALVGEPVSFDGSGSTDDGTIIGWFWDFGDGAADTGEMTTHTYNAAGTYTVTLQVTDDEGNVSTDQTTATISDPQLLDLDIRRFSTSKTSRVGRDVTIKLTVENGGEVQGQAIATVTGMQNGIEVYSQRLNVFDDIGRGATSFSFQAHTVEAPGDIEWTATIADGDPDDDTAVTVTTVK
jgi:PKD repeat protein